MDMAKSKNVKGTTQQIKGYLAASCTYLGVVAIDANGGCVEVIDRDSWGY